MGRRIYHHPEAVLTAIADRAAARVLPGRREVWTINFRMVDGSRRYSQASSRPDALKAIATVFGLDEAGEYYSAWIEQHWKRQR